MSPILIHYYLDHYSFPHCLSITTHFNRENLPHHPLFNSKIHVPTTNWHSPGCLPSASIRIKSCDASAADLQHPKKEFRVESRNEAVCAQGKAGRAGLQIVRHSQELII